MELFDVNIVYINAQRQSASAKADEAMAQKRNLGNSQELSASNFLI